MVTNKDLTEIYDTHLDEIKSSVDSLKSFFDTAGRNYKYNFNEQLMIHAQKPESTACAELDMWNKLGLRVKKGSKSIRLFEINGENFTKKYIFDISDTYSPQGKKIKLWRLEEKYQNGIANLINEKYNSGKKSNFNESLRSLSDRFTDDIKDGISDSIDFSEDNIDEEKLINSVKNSVLYIAMKRFENDNPDLYFKYNDFEELLKCNAKDFRMVGGFVSLISEACISYVKSQEKEVKKLLERQEEKEDVRDFVQQEGQVSRAEHRVAENREKEPQGDSSQGQILANEEEIPTGKRQISDRTPDNERAVLGTSRSDGERRTEYDEQFGRENGEERGRDGTNENGRPTQMGGLDEQYQEQSGGDSLQGADLHLDVITPAEIDLILARGSNFRNSKIRIFEWFKEEKSKAENINFLKDEHGTGGSYSAISELDISEDHSSKGIEITKGRAFNPTAKVTLSWSQVEKRLQELISEDKYLSKDEKEQIAKQQQETQKENENAVYSYKIGDEVFVNAKAYNVHDIKNNEVVLQDPFFPLSIQTHTKKELNLLLSQSSRNDKFKVLADDILKSRSTFVANLADNEFVWTYYNPDSTSGGQFVINYLDFDDIILAKESTQTPDDFFDYLGENCKQELVDKGTVDYPIMLRDFMTEDYDFEGCTEQTRDSIFKIAYDEVNKSKSKNKDFEKEQIRFVDSKYKELFTIPDGAFIEIEFPDKTVKEKCKYIDDYHTSIGGRTYHITEFAEHMERKNAKYRAVSEGKTQDIEIKKEPTPNNTTEEPKYYSKINPNILMTDEMLKRVPKLYGQQKIPSADKTVHAVYFVPFRSAWTWYLTEYDRESHDAFGLVCGDVVEWGYFNLDELQEVKAQRLVLEDFPKTFREIKDTELAKQMTETELKTAFAGKLSFRKNEENKSISAEKELEKITPEKVSVEEFYKENTIDLSDYIGTEIELDKRKFILDSVSGDYVSLRDATFEGDCGFPIFRREHTALVKFAIDEKIREEAEKERKNIPANNFKIEGEISESLPPSVRLENNIKAIKTLKAIEKEKRNATIDEQKILSRYVGWGGLSEVFNEDNKHYSELKNLLSEKEYKSARASTLTAFYTPSVVINSVYKALENAGFNTGNILEPSCGVGNFIGLLPDTMSNSKLYGVELDSLSGRIAKKLYPKNNIQIKGFEKASFSENFFDVAIGNIPFGNYQVYDKDFKNNGFMIHDYFFAKALEKVRPGGVVAFVTSKGTLDKKDSKVREYLAQRADLVGAIRLPDNTFKGSAGTEVTSDIIFLQKRENLNYEKQDWTEVLTNENGITMNSYFISNPQMILGEMKEVSTRFGKDFACKEIVGSSLEELLTEALSNIKIENHFQNIIENKENEREIIPAEADVNNFSYTIKDNKLYFRENSIMRAVTGATATTERIKGMIKLRDTVRDILDFQLTYQSDEQIKAKQRELNTLYDDFTKKYGLINSSANKKAFNQDDGYFLLCSLENLDENGKLQSKADIFTKRTMNVYKEITHTNTSSEVLTVSISEKACVNLEFMSKLTDKPKSEIISDLKGVIYRNFGDTFDKEKPFKIDDFPYVTADEYLSGNIRKKLACAKEMKRFYPEFSEEFDKNIVGLKNVMPEELTAADIHVKLGSTWVPTNDIENFIFETLDTPFYYHHRIKVTYSKFNSEWRISGKNIDRDNIAVYSTYGTRRVNAYKIIENTLNMRSVKVYDTINDNERVLNVEETRKAQIKQELVKEKFSNWVFENPARRERLCKIYNEKFNSIRPREYDGSHIVFRGMNAEITLKQHQRNAIAHALYGGNTLLAHTMGAGKTFEMTAISQESKRLGLCHKSLIAVPNYLTEQWAKEYLQLYPNANIIVATKKDFEKANRKKFCAKIATGNYDAVIIGHSQLIKIPLSEMRQKICIQREIEDLEKAIIEAKEQQQERVSIKDLERSQKSLEKRLEKLNNTAIKDDVVTFEELGVDRLFIDESHAFKNLAVVSKMRNIAGVAQSESQRALDLYMKCQYINEITDNQGVIFATGTPLSNSMSELYTIQKYLQYDTLEEHGIQNFDSWASTFGEVSTSMELDPAGNGFRMKTRFSRFYNLPELMSMFKEVADIKTADVLNLPTPEAVFENIVVKPTDLQKEMILSLGDRAERVRSRSVDVRVDNMLLITNDGRKIALDQRLYDDTLPDTDNNKSSMCANKMFEIWEKTKEQKSTQICFCDLSTPKNDGSFNIYDDIKNKLIKKGVPEEEIAFIHDAKNEEQRKKLFEQVRKGNVRFIFGSTAKLGAGANLQNKLIALHHIDTPWRSSDLLQREGRIVRQGNENEKVYIYRYVTEGSFDSYIFQLIENKQRFSSQIMTSKAPVRAAEDIDEVTLSYSEVKALATGNPKIQERCNLEAEVNKLKLLKADYLNQKYVNEDKLIKYYPTEIKNCQEIIQGLESDKLLRDNAPKATEKHISPMTVNGVVYTKKEDAGNAIIANMRGVSDGKKTIGEYKGFTLRLSYDIMKTAYVLDLQGKLFHRAILGKDTIGNITRIDNALGKLEEKLKNANERLNSLKTQEENAKILIKEPFKDEQELSEKSKRLKELDAELKVDFQKEEREEIPRTTQKVQHSNNSAYKASVCVPAM